jgi:hypothetical protein
MVRARKDGRGRIDVSAKTVAILNGEEDLSVWSDEELIRGQRKAKNGKWVGPPPIVVPQAVHAERARRLMSKAHDLLRESTVDAVTLLRDVITDEDAPLALRVQAADLVLARTLPKNVAVHVGVGAEPKFLSMIRAGIVAGGQAIGTGEDSDIIDAEVIDDDDIVFDE